MLGLLASRAGKTSLRKAVDNQKATGVPLFCMSVEAAVVLAFSEDSRVPALRFMSDCFGWNGCCQKAFAGGL